LIEADQPMGWEALDQWGDDVARIAPLAGGVANDVWSVRVNGRLAVARLGARSDADLAWETELLRHLDRAGHAETGTKVDLGAMPPEGVARCRAAWARLIGRQTCVVHGDADNLGNVRMTADRVALIDWDEAHVDVPDLDLALPHNAADLDEAAYDVAAQAAAAWQAAVCWDDDHAVARLAEVRVL
jgi:hypothetical protein